MRKILLTLLTTLLCSFNLFGAATYTDAPLYWGESTSEPSSGTLNSTYLTVYRDGNSSTGSKITMYTMGSTGSISTGSSDKPKIMKSTGSATDKLYFQATGGRYFASIKIILKASTSTGDQTQTKNFIINTNHGPLKANQLSAVSGYYYGAAGLKSNETDVTLSNFDTYNTSSNGFDIKHNSSDKYDYIELTFKDTATVTKVSLDPSSTSKAVLVSAYYVSLRNSCTSHSVTAATNNASYGTAAAASTTVCEGNTTTVTATPATGYQVTNWAVTGTGASISPSGESNSNTTTLTMGTTNATVTATFGCKAPTSLSITGTTAYTEGQDISLTASASDKSASATYTWYKGATWDAASATTPVQAASTSGASLSIADCVEDNAGTYWCEISNGTGCDAHVSKAITVSAVACSPSISASPSSADYCKDDGATALSFTGSGHNAQKWQYYDGDSWEDIDGATSTTYTPSTSATGSTQYRVVTTCDSYTTTATSSAATITVKTSPNLTITLN